MNEIIINIFLVIVNDLVTEFRAISYELEGGDDNKIKFLKSRVREDFDKSYKFNAPTDKHGQYMSYKKFHKLEKSGMQFQLFEEMFERFGVPENPLVCVTPVVDGEFYAEIINEE